MLDVRIIKTNAVGADEWVGIDNINVNCFHPAVGQSSVYGQALDANGRGINQARVTILNLETQETRTALTNPFGRFSFYQLSTSTFYTATIQHKRYNFKPNRQVSELLGDRDDMDFFSIDGN